ncbi:MAG: hypothetical protein H7831_14850 [Magnetococcus sp. WYHC-3]
MDTTQPTGFDLSRFEGIPPLALTEAAWLVGITPEAFKRFMESTGMDMVTDAASEPQVALLDLIRLGFQLLGQKESQVAMLRMQLAATLEREKELAAALKQKVEGDLSFVLSGEDLEQSLLMPAERKPSRDKDSPAERKKKKKKDKFKDYLLDADFE